MLQKTYNTMSTKLMLARCKSEDAQVDVTALFFQLDLLYRQS